MLVINLHRIAYTPLQRLKNSITFYNFAYSQKTKSSSYVTIFHTPASHNIHPAYIL